MLQQAARMWSAPPLPRSEGEGKHGHTRDSCMAKPTGLLESRQHCNAAGHVQEMAALQTQSSYVVLGKNFTWKMAFLLASDSRMPRQPAASARPRPGSCKGCHPAMSCLKKGRACRHRQLRELSKRGRSKSLSNTMQGAVHVTVSMHTRQGRYLLETWASEQRASQQLCPPPSHLSHAESSAHVT